MNRFGFLRVATATPILRVADCAYNAERILAIINQAEDLGAAVLLFPELSLTGYKRADLFKQPVLPSRALAGFRHIAAESAKRFSGLAIVGLPLALDDRLFNCAAVISQGKILGLVPKSFIPNYK